jgi:hypothetical protein
MRKHLRVEKPFEQPSENILSYQYDVNKKRRGLSSGIPCCPVSRVFGKLVAYHPGYMPVTRH